MPQIQLRLPEELRRYTGQNAVLNLEATSARGVLDALFAEYPTIRSRVIDGQGKLFPYLTLLHNGQTLKHDAAAGEALSEGDTVELFALAAGG